METDKPICNRNCFSCPYPDCIDDSVTPADEAELSRIERNYILDSDARKRQPKQTLSPEERVARIRESQRAYREAHRKELAEKQRQRAHKLRETKEQSKKERTPK